MVGEKSAHIEKITEDDYISPNRHTIQRVSSLVLIESRFTQREKKEEALYRMFN